ncbi:interleukin-27 receptor subunit alpha isoform X2 [Bombina bombina]|uniref:interleukin-27 receptor subunit alpha isoform X2 n=1 Tax=Bombina bombina TaxID=8345 RepID=UPI00235AE601|nr:interleukin-27 receptor subunit alpha isoform X2 [Bombina bombina]
MPSCSSAMFLIFPILLISIVFKGDAEECEFYCIQLNQDKGLNCTWKGNTNTQPIVQLQRLNLSSHPDPTSRLRFQAQPEKNWLLIPRYNLTKYYQYELQLEADGKVHILTLKYPQDEETGLLEPPVLKTSVNFSREDTLVVQVFWSHSAVSSSQLQLELRYQRKGSSNWNIVDQSDIEHTVCELLELEPYTEYEVQIRYLPEQTGDKKGSRWSDAIFFTTPEEAPWGTLDVWRSVENGSFLFIYWKPLDPHFARGHIRHYQVKYLDMNQNNTESENRQCCDIRLPANSKDVCLRAENSEGLGPSTCVTLHCSYLPLPLDIRAWGNNAGGITLSLTVPLHFQTPSSYLVEWTEVTKDGNRGLNWTRIPLPEGLLYSPTENEDLLNNITLPGEFTPYVLYRISVFALYLNDCSGPVSSIVYSQEGVPSGAPDFTIDLVSTTDLFISWEEIPVWQHRGMITHYTVYLNNTENVSRHIVSGRNLSLSGLSPGTVYNVWMTASTFVGEGPPGKVKTFQTADSTLSAVFLFILSLSGILIFALLNPYSLRILKMSACQKIPKPKLVSFEKYAFSNVYHPNEMFANPTITRFELESRIQDASLTQDPSTTCLNNPTTACLLDPSSASPLGPNSVLSQDPVSVGILDPTTDWFPETSPTSLDDSSTSQELSAAYCTDNDPNLAFSQDPTTMCPQDATTNWLPETSTDYHEDSCTAQKQSSVCNKVASSFISGYEKHFMPTPEEVMGFC